MDKKDARKIALSNRKSKDKMKASRTILDAIISSGILDRYNHIGIYYPIGNEIDIMKLMDIYQNKCFYLPITREEIAFIPYHKGDTLVDGPFHTKEPKGDIISREQIECFFIPCVAVTKEGRRIGYGKGYYDRYLDGYKGHTIGIVYKEDIYESSFDSFDVVMTDIFVG